MHIMSCIDTQQARGKTLMGVNFDSPVEIVYVQSLRRLNYK